MNMERAARIHQYGAPEVLAVEPVEVTAPGPGEVRIRHTAIGLNFVEVYFRRGTFPVPAFPAILGNEAAGVVEAVGRDVRGVAVGDRVAYADGPLGSYATLSGRSCGPHPGCDQRRAGCGFVSTRSNGAIALEGSRYASAWRHRALSRGSWRCWALVRPVGARWAFASSVPFPMRARQR
jgi:Zn-dependent alcohol dehydrogenase